MPNLNSFRDVDRKILSTLSGRDRMVRLLADQQHTIASASRALGEYPEQVSRCIGNKRPLPRVRDGLARLLGISRAVVDRVIENDTK